MAKRTDPPRRRDQAMAPPRIYLVHGSVAASPESREALFARAAGMGFDRVCWSPPGLDRSPTAPPGIDGRHLEPLAELAREARAHGLSLTLETGVADAADFVACRQLGVGGFLVAAAHRRPASRWREVLDAVRAEAGEVAFAAEAFGRPWEEIEKLAGAGFDFLLNSAAWWDYRQPWFLRQQRELARQVATLATPEPLREARLMHRLTHVEAAARQAVYRARYRLAAVVSSGVVCPMGFEIGASTTFDGRSARASDWDFARERAPFDLSDDIAYVNRLKAEAPALRGEGESRAASAPGAPVLALVRGGDGMGDAACLLVNATGSERRPPSRAELALAAGGAVLRDPGTGLADGLAALRPFEARLLFAEARTVATARPSAKRSEARLRQLAADRVVVERVGPEIDGGRFAVKRVLGETLAVEADIFADGHEVIDAALAYRPTGAAEWREAPMRFLDNDRWAGEAPLTEIGRWTYTVLAWRDLFATWRRDVAKKHDAGQGVSLELIEGRRLVERHAEAAEGAAAEALASLLARVRATEDEGDLLGLLESEDAAAAMRAARCRVNLSRYGRELEVYVDRPLAANAAWYEMVPRSQSGDPRRHGTFDDTIARLPYVRDLGFDVLYFTPIHPIGRTNRKGRNNSLVAGPDDPGSPYATGSEEGGHTAIHPELGDFDSFARLLKAARGHGLEVALDFAIQCSPDHPWIAEHPEWFDWRPDGSIKFAENPPKKYEDIVNVHFYRDALPSLWHELRDVVRFWIDKGVTIFRVDNPHTKPVPFWEWAIREIQDEHPGAIFLSEAFTRPKMMRRLAKVGFTQSYSYFTWRNTKQELTEYLTELTRGESRDYMRPNFFVNTPDINPVYLQTSGRAGFQVRLVLAATLSPLYGVYNGFELCEATPVPGKEEYLNSEKYEIKAWDWDRPGHIRDDVRLINRIRRDNPALWRFANLTFLNAWNENILAYYKTSVAGDNLIVVAVNLDPGDAHGAAFEVPLWEFGLPDSAAVEVVDLVEERRLTWYGKQQHVWLDPDVCPYAIWRLVPPGAA